MKTQKQAIVDEIVAILGSNYDSTKSVKSSLTKDNFKDLVKAITDGIVANEIAYSKSTSDLAALDKYVKGTISNHIRRAKELNGGIVKASTKSYNAVKAMRDLLSTLEEGSDEYNEVLVGISKAEKNKAKKSLKIDFSEIPDNLKDLANTLL